MMDTVVCVSICHIEDRVGVEKLQRKLCLFNPMMDGFGYLDDLGWRPPPG